MAPDFWTGQKVGKAGDRPDKKIKKRQQSTKFEQPSQIVMNKVAALI